MITNVWLMYLDTGVTVSVQLIDTSGAVFDCGELLKQRVSGQDFEYQASCPPTLTNRVQLTFSDSCTWHKIAFLDNICTHTRPSFTELGYIPEDYKFDLLTETSLTVPLPTITLAPLTESCYTWTWKLYRASDGVDMSLVLADTTSTLTFTDTEMTLAHETTDETAS